MDTTIMYPKKCRKGIRTIVNEVGASVETAYAMMLMTAMLIPKWQNRASVSALGRSAR